MFLRSAGLKRLKPATDGTAVSPVFGDKTSQNLTGLPPKRDCSPKRVITDVCYGGDNTHLVPGTVLGFLRRGTLSTGGKVPPTSER